MPQREKPTEGVKPAAVLNSKEKLSEIARLIRYLSLVSTTEAGSGHPTSSLSAAELMACLLYGGTFRYFPHDPKHPNNDRIIFSKGHASPLFYAMWAPAGEMTEEEMLTLRTFGSPLEGHPTPAFRHVEAATGSLGQGLAIGVGEALNAKYLDNLPYRTYILLGDSEMSEGSQWESIQIAAHYGLDNLIGVIDVNRLGQRGETMYDWDADAYARRVGAFGWETVVIDGHDIEQCLSAYARAAGLKGRPLMVVAHTVKGKGVSFLENVEGMHGKALGREDLGKALQELGPVDKGIRAGMAEPEDLRPSSRPARQMEQPSYDPAKPVATRNAYGNALKRIFPAHPDMVVLDAEISNSTKAEVFKDAYPERFFEMYIAEQNMAGAALGLERRGKMPFISTFAAFMTRAFDQIRMNQYSGATIKYCGSHAGVSIGEDGPSQMGLEDIAMFRTVHDCAVLYPCDPYETERLVEAMAGYAGPAYLRTTRGKTPVIYSAEDTFKVGGSRVLRRSEKDAVAVVAAGIAVHEALKAHEELRKDGIFVRVIDLYSIKPIDHETLHQAATETRAIITVEDHKEEGGLGEAVRDALKGVSSSVFSLAVRKIPKSGKPDAQMDDQEISSAAIEREVREVL
jgi:transketolase